MLEDCGANAVTAVQIGGASGVCLTPDEFSRQIAFEDVPTAGAFMIFGPDRDLFEVARNFAHFFAHESCGFCTPCRVGTAIKRNIMDKIAEGRGSRYEINDLMRLVDFMKRTSHCGLGETAGNAVRDTLAQVPAGLRTTAHRARFRAGGRSRSRAGPPRARSPRATTPKRISERRHERDRRTILIDEVPVPFTPGQTILEAAPRRASTSRIFATIPNSSRTAAASSAPSSSTAATHTACTMKAAVGQEVDVDTPELNAMRRSLVQMLFIEGNHFCPGCEKSGNCQLQALGYEYEMMTPHFVEFYPHREVDASHPDVLIDFNRCILCELCVRASRDVDGKDVFALAGRGHGRKSIINSPTGKLGDSDFAVTDRAAHVCPVGAILVKRVGFETPIGERRYDLEPISEEATRCEVGGAK